MSFVIDCEDHAEVDRPWESLTANGGERGPCGWLKDRFGLSWKIVPHRLGELVNDPDPERARRAMEAMLTIRSMFGEDTTLVRDAMDDGYDVGHRTARAVAAVFD